MSDFTFDCESREAFYKGKRLPLTIKQYELLRLLVEHQNETALRSMLMEKLYPADWSQPAENTVDVFIFFLRKKLAEATGGEACIETVWGKGYRLKTAA